MTGADLKERREGKQWTQQQLADLLNGALDRRYTSATVSQWELGKRPVPSHVAAFLDELNLAEALGHDPAAGQPEQAKPAEPDADLPPGGPSPPPGGQPPLSSPTGHLYGKVCTELFEMLGTCIGILGAATGNERLIADGQIIAADKVALGRAYGKLAETNETFRRMITNGVSSGVWFEVALVTGGTVSKLWTNHSLARRDGGAITAPGYPAEPGPVIAAVS